MLRGTPNSACLELSILAFVRLGMGFRGYGLECRVWSSGCGVSGSRFRVQGVGLQLRVLSALH